MRYNKIIHTKLFEPLLTLQISAYDDFDFDIVPLACNLPGNIGKGCLGRIGINLELLIKTMKYHCNDNNTPKKLEYREYGMTSKKQKGKFTLLVREMSFLLIQRQPTLVYQGSGGHCGGQQLLGLLSYNNTTVLIHTEISTSQNTQVSFVCVFLSITPHSVVGCRSSGDSVWNPMCIPI